MPIATIDAPAVLSADAKRRLVRKINAALEEAFSPAEATILLREYLFANLAQGGQLLSDRIAAGAATADSAAAATP